MEISRSTSHPAESELIKSCDRASFSHSIGCCVFVTFGSRCQHKDMASRTKTAVSKATWTSSRKRKVAEKERDTEVVDLTVSPVATPKKTPSKRRKQSVVEKDDIPPSSPEKRAKRCRDHPPQGVLVKKQRVMTQRMFLV